MQLVIAWGQFQLIMIFYLLVTTSCFTMPRVGYAAESLNEPVDTLETIEIPATAVSQAKRHIVIPLPTMQAITPLPANIPGHIALKRLETIPRIQVKIARDPIADLKGTPTPARPAKAERPLYPQFAREQGWEGTVVLRINLNQAGHVMAVRTQKSSGFPILDGSAVQSVKTWIFEPAKDGEFPIPVTVDLPVRFDLDEH